MNIASTVSSYGKEATAVASDLSVVTMVAIAMAVALFAFALRYGKSSIVSLILAFYIAILAFTHFPYTKSFSFFFKSDTQILAFNIFVFAVFVIVAYITVERVVWTEYPRQKILRLFDAIILAFSATTLSLAFAYNVLPATSFSEFPVSIKLLFDSPVFFFWWLIFPIVSILLFTKR